MEIKPTSMTTNILMTVINEKPEAFAYVQGNKISGTVGFYPYLSGMVMIYEIKDLPKNDSGFYGFHIHEGNTCINDTKIPFEKTKDHYNPTNKKHPAHLGDLPPLFASKGRAWGMIYLDKVKPKDIINRTIVVHQNADDFHTQPSGNSGEKIACGEIQSFQ